MTMPFANPAAGLPRDISEDSEKSPTARILVVDDDRLVRWAMAETLGAKGYEISEAADVESAKRAILAHGAPDLVILDLRLPGCGDFCMVSFIRAQTPNAPIVLTTADLTPEVIEQAAHLGAVVVSKPFDMNDLTSIVGRALAPRSA